MTQTPQPGVMAITMAGMGSRFLKSGYDCPKYEIKVLGRHLFDWSMLGLMSFAEAGWRFRFAARADTGAVPFIEARCAEMGIRIDEILEIDHLTNGQATTAFMLSEQAKASAPFAVFNIDTFVAPGNLNPELAAKWCGWIPCFPAPGDGWSFARTDAAGRVVELREKQRISEHATVGFYGFDSVARYNDCYRAYYADASRVEKSEYYIAPLYNQLIEDGLSVGIAQLSMDDVGMLGTPDQVEAFKTTPPKGAQPYVKL